MNFASNVNRRHLIQAIALAAMAASGSAMAQAWPSKPISLIVPFPAGGTTDVLARALAEELTQSLGQAVIVESKPGAGATLVSCRISTLHVSCITSGTLMTGGDDAPDACGCGTHIGAGAAT